MTVGVGPHIYIHGKCHDKWNAKSWEEGGTIKKAWSLSIYPYYWWPTPTVTLTLVYSCAYAQMCKRIALILRAQEEKSLKNMPKHLSTQTMSSICRHKSLEKKSGHRYYVGNNLSATLIHWQQKERCVKKRCWVGLALLGFCLSKTCTLLSFSLHNY